MRAFHNDVNIKEKGHVPPTTEPKKPYESPIIGRIERTDLVRTRKDAIARAKRMGYAWYHDGLWYDTRCPRWHVFRISKPVSPESRHTIGFV